MQIVQILQQQRHDDFQLLESTRFRIQDFRDSLPHIDGPFDFEKEEEPAEDDNEKKDGRSHLPQADVGSVREENAVECEVLNEGQSVRHIDDEVEQDEQQSKHEDYVPIGVVRLAILDLSVLKIPQLTVDGGAIGSLQELRLEGLGDFRFNPREHNYGEVLVHHLDYPAVLLEEVQSWRAFRQFFLGVVLQDLVDLEPQRQHHFLLLAELKILPLVLQLELFEPLVDSVQLLYQQLVGNGQQLADGFLINIF